LINPRALAGGSQQPKPEGVLTPSHTFRVKTRLLLVRFFPPAKARGLIKSIGCFLSDPCPKWATKQPWYCQQGTAKRVKAKFLILDGCTSWQSTTRVNKNKKNNENINNNKDLNYGLEFSQTNKNHTRSSPQF
jgi:hypothetical protein